MPVFEIIFDGTPTEMRDHTCNSAWIVQTFTVRNISSNPVTIDNYIVETQAGHNIDRDYDIYSHNLPFSLSPGSSTIRGFRLKDIGDPPAVSSNTQVTVKLYFGAVGNFESASKSYRIVCPGSAPTQRHALK